MQKTLLLVLLTALLLSLAPQNSIHAVSPSPSPSPISEETITENLKKRLQDTLTSSGSATNPTAFRGFVGQVKDVIKDTVIIQDQAGKTNVVISDETTLLRSPGNNAIELEDIRLEDYVIAIGTTIGKDELAGIRLILSTTPLTSTNKTSGLSVITKVNKSSLILANGTTLAFSGKTIIKTNTSTSLVAADLLPGDTIIFTATINDDITTATVIMRIKSSIPPSPSLSPSPSLKPSPKN